MRFAFLVLLGCLTVVNCSQGKKKTKKKVPGKAKEFYLTPDQYNYETKKYKVTCQFGISVSPKPDTFKVYQMKSHDDRDYKDHTRLDLSLNIWLQECTSEDYKYFLMHFKALKEAYKGSSTQRFFADNDQWALDDSVEWKPEREANWVVKNIKAVAGMAYTSMEEVS